MAGRVALKLGTYDKLVEVGTKFNIDNKVARMKVDQDLNLSFSLNRKITNKVSLTTVF